MNTFNSICPHCDHAVAITESQYSSNQHTLQIPNKDGRRTVKTHFYVCPNPNCNKFVLTAGLHESIDGGYSDKLIKCLQVWNLVPDSRAKSFPTYIPKAIREDYQEACLICDLSPKASATLSRRCLQGMIRDYWGVKPARLIDEINAIKDRVEPLTWDAINALRQLGNIGAHMEKDINMIVDVDPNEAKLLIALVETLFKDWYIQREERKTRMNSLIEAASNKKSI